MHYRTILILTFFISTQLFSQDIAVIQYNGGGDWYANPTALPNLIKFCNDNINTTINKKPKVVSPSSVDLFDYPFVHMTGHGNVYFTDDDAKNLRDYLLSGGFLHIDDNYGMDQYLRKELIKVFPDKKLEEIYDEINRLEKTDIEEFKYYNYEEKFRPLILLALALILIEWLARNTLFKSFI